MQLARDDRSRAVCRACADLAATGYPAPLQAELRQKAEPLPSASANRAEQIPGAAAVPSSSGAEEPKERKIPKWVMEPCGNGSPLQRVSGLLG
jgi:hypothetical protein